MESILPTPKRNKWQIHKYIANTGNLIKQVLNILKKNSESRGNIKKQFIGLLEKNLTTKVIELWKSKSSYELNEKMKWKLLTKNQREKNEFACTCGGIPLNYISSLNIKLGSVRREICLM